MFSALGPSLRTDERRHSELQLPVLWSVYLLQECLVIFWTVFDYLLLQVLCTFQSSDHLSGAHHGTRETYHISRYNVKLIRHQKCFMWMQKASPMLELHMTQAAEPEWHGSEGHEMLWPTSFQSSPESLCEHRPPPQESIQQLSTKMTETMLSLKIIHNFELIYG